MPSITVVESVPFQTECGTGPSTNNDSFAPTVCVPAGVSTRARSLTTMIVRMGVHLRWPSTARFEVSDRPADNFAERMFRAVSGKELFCQKTGVAGRGPESVHRPYGYS